MGHTADALVDTGRIVSGQPIVAVVAVLTGMVAPVVSFAFGLVPLIGSLIYFVFVQPVFVGGLLHMADRGMDGETGVNDWADGVQDHYASLAGAFGLLALLVLAFVMLAIVFVFVFGVAGGITAGAGSDPGAGAGFAGVFGAMGIGLLVVVVLGLVVGILVQFVDTAVVVGGAGAVDAFGQSIATVKQHPLSVLGYSLLRGASLLFASLGPAIFFWGSVLGIGALGSGGEAAGAGLGLLALAFVLSTVGYLGTTVFHALYYRRAGAYSRDDEPADGRQAGRSGDPARTAD